MFQGSSFSQQLSTKSHNIFGNLQQNTSNTQEGFFANSSNTKERPFANLEANNPPLFSNFKANNPPDLKSNNDNNGLFGGRASSLFQNQISFRPPTSTKKDRSGNESNVIQNQGGIFSQNNLQQQSKEKQQKTSLFKNQLNSGKSIFGLNETNSFQKGLFEPKSVNITPPNQLSSNKLSSINSLTSSSQPQFNNPFEETYANPRYGIFESGTKKHHQAPRIQSTGIFLKDSSNKAQKYDQSSNCGLISAKDQKLIDSLFPGVKESQKNRPSIFGNKNSEWSDNSWKQGS